jgi:hypothetical protein
MTENLVDLTVDDDSNSEILDDSICLPVGVNATDDVVAIESDDDVGPQIATIASQQAKASRLAQEAALKLSHPKAVQAASRKRKLRLAEEAEARKLEEEEAKRERKKKKQQARKKIMRARRTETRKRIREEKEQAEKDQEQARKDRERQRKAEAEALRKNPPTACNFVVIDSDPEEDLTSSRRSPAKKTAAAPAAAASSTTSAPAPARAAARTAAPASTTGPSPTASPPSKQAGRKRKSQPYACVGGINIEVVRPKSRFRPNLDFDYQTSRDAAQEEQERLFREAAARMKQKHSQAPASAPRHNGNTVYGPTFEVLVRNVQERYPLHWKWKNPHSCLGVPPGTGLPQVKAQYRQLVRCYHPDKSRQADTTTKFHAVVLAYNKICQAQLEP